MKYKTLLSILVVSLICALAGFGTMAWFTSSATSESNTFTAGTLILGGVIDGQDVNNTFKSVTFANMEPGEPPVKVQETLLKNVGTLPFYLYRITASELVDLQTDNDKDDRILDGVLDVTITIGGEEVYFGKLSQLVEENGGYFDPIYQVQPGASLPMVISVAMDKEAGNVYQGLSMACDFTVYAAQNGTPLLGQPAGTVVNLGSTSIFSATGQDMGDWIWFTFNDRIDIQEGNKNAQWLQVDIKHHKAQPDSEIDARIRFQKNQGYQVAPVQVSGVLNPQDVDVDGENGIIKIKKQKLINLGWQGFEVNLGAEINGEEEFLGWKYWTLNRN